MIGDNHRQGVLVIENNMIPTSKVCTKCKIEKMASEFYRRNRNPNYLESWCKSCTRAMPKTKMVVCHLCKQEKLHRSKGLCDACWQREWKKERQSKRITPPSHKVCIKCNNNKPISEFPKYNGSLDGYSVYCKMCYKEYGIKRKQNKELVERDRKYARDRWANDQEFREKHSSRRREYDRQQWHNNQEYRLRKQERDKKRIRKHDPVYGRIHTARRRAMLRGLPYDLTKDQWHDILAKFNFECAYCANEPKGKLHQEHKVPASRGGGYTKDNIVPACQTCNNKKGTKTDVEFVEYIREHPKEFKYFRRPL